jgi:hypothetical protein
MTHFPYCYQFATCWRQPRTLIDCFSCLLSCDILLGCKASHNANSGVKKHSCFFYDDHHHAPVAIVTEVGENGHTLLELWCKLLVRDYTNQRVFLVSLVDGALLQLVVMHIFFRACDVGGALGAIRC